jgi:mannose-6-phosphate isomerase-like protein (cupin superfamily)
MAAIRSALVSAEQERYSPGGVAEIRTLLAFPAGELTHARIAPGRASRPSRVYPSAEWFYVLSGHGEVWDGASTGAGLVELTSGRLVRIAPGTPYQYRSDGEAQLDLLVAVMPQWRPEYHGFLEVQGPWQPTHDDRGPVDPRGDLGIAPELLGVAVYEPDAAHEYRAPDGSTVCPLGSEANGGIALCRLSPGVATTPVRHRSVEELWYVLAGEGEVSRRHGAWDPFVDPLRPGSCVDIGLGLTFQFRCTGNVDLSMVLLTMPQWPGSDEAVQQPALATWEPLG